MALRRLLRASPAGIYELDGATEPGRRGALAEPPCLIGIETGMATHYVARKLITLGHAVMQVPSAYAKPFSTRSQERLP